MISHAFKLHVHELGLSNTRVKSQPERLLPLAHTSTVEQTLIPCFEVSCVAVACRQVQCHARNGLTTGWSSTTQCLCACRLMLVTQSKEHMCSHTCAPKPKNKPSKWRNPAFPPDAPSQDQGSPSCASTKNCVHSNAAEQGNGPPCASTAPACA